MRLRVRLGALLSILLLWAGLNSAVSADQVTFYHNDPLGSPVAATDMTGAVIWREVYQPFGTRVREESADNTVWFTGKPQNNATGLVNMGARQYSPEIGRFLSPDPANGLEIAPEHLFNRYAYANNNPYRYVDPDGNFPVIAVAFAALDFYTGYKATGTVLGGLKAVATGVINPLKKVKAVGAVGRLATKKAEGVVKEFLPRKVPGRDGGLSAQIIERQNGEVISRTHKVFKDGKILHQHQNHVGKEGGVRQFPGEWTGTTTKNAPYENIAPKFKPDRVPGGRTF